MKTLNSALLASALLLAPAAASAEVSVTDLLMDDASLSISQDLNLNLNLDLDYDLDIARGAGPGPGGHGPGPRPGAGPGPRPGHGPGPGPAPRRTVVRHYRTNVRPVVVVEQPATVVVSDTSSSSSSSSSERVGSRFGMGIRGVGLVPSATILDNGTELKSKIAGGLGFYLKVRPIRWISIELINDYLFGHYDSVSSDCDNYFRVPLVVGLRGHVFDYGNLDVYGVAAFAATFVTLDDGNDRLDQEERFVQFGGQFGAGISLVAGGFEIGLDARYTIDTAPEKAPIGYGSVDQDELIHGFLFSLNVGFAI